MTRKPTTQKLTRPTIKHQGQLNMPMITPAPPRSPTFTIHDPRNTKKPTKSTPPWVKFHNHKVYAIQHQSQINNGKTIIMSSCVLAQITIESLGIIGNDGIITDEISKPNSPCYFIARCILRNQSLIHDNSTAWIITDGKKYREIWYYHQKKPQPQKPRQQKKQNTNPTLTPNKPTPLPELGPYDKELINIAIKHWTTINLTCTTKQ